MQEDKKTEIEAARAMLLERGVKFSIPRKGISKYLHKNKEREFVIRQSTLGTLFRLSQIYNSIEFDDSSVTGDNWLSEQKKAYQYAPKLAEIVAIAYLNAPVKILLRKKLLCWYFMQNLTPSRMVSLAQMIVLEMNNMKDFITTIRLTSVSPLTQPKRETLSPEDNGG